MALDVNSPEHYGLMPGDTGYDTFGTDFPTHEQPVSDYEQFDNAMGQELGGRVLGAISNDKPKVLVVNGDIPYSEFDTHPYEFNNGCGITVPPLTPENQRLFDEAREKVREDSRKKRNEVYVKPDWKMCDVDRSKGSVFGPKVHDIPDDIMDSIID